MGQTESRHSGSRQRPSPGGPLPPHPREASETAARNISTDTSDTYDDDLDVEVHGSTPVLFHATCGENVQVSPDRTKARRVESFCKAVAFTSRPVGINERVYLRFSQVSRNWSGVLRFGFTSNSPDQVSCRSNLAKYVCPDMTSKPGNWAKALRDGLVEEGGVLVFWVTRAGAIRYRVENTQLAPATLISGVNTGERLWGLFDIYGNTTCIELLDRRMQLPRQIGPPHRPANTLNNLRALPPPRPQPQVLNNSTHLPSHHPASQRHPRLAQQHVVANSPPDPAAGGAGQAPRQQPPGPDPMTFHPQCRGAHLLPFTNDRRDAVRDGTQFCLGYCFTSRPVRPGETVTVQVRAVDPAYTGGLAFGLTSCDPASIDPRSLPEDSNLLLDRPEYWVVVKNVAGQPRPRDRFAFTLMPDGRVRYSKNGYSTAVVVHADASLPLWFFFDVYGSTTGLRLDAVTGPPRGTGEGPPARSGEPPARSTSNPALSGGPALAVRLPHSSSASPMVAASASPAPPPQPPQPRPPQQQTPQPRPPQQQTPQPAPAQQPGQPLPQPPPPSSESPSAAVTSAASGAADENHFSECVVCYERPVNSVLYSCGHMAMCHQCALTQWRHQGVCPICRAHIIDVIKPYKS